VAKKQQPCLTFAFREEGAQKFCDATREGVRSSGVQNETVAFGKMYAKAPAFAFGGGASWRFDVSVRGER
jgi:hypothetical protein